MLRSAKLISLFFLVSLATTACSGPRTIVRPDPETLALLDSARAENARLAGLLRLVEDSLQFYQDVETGQYWRERSTMQAEIDRLEYLLAVARDSADARWRSDVTGQTAGLLLVDDLFSSGTTLSVEGQRLLDALADHLRREFPWGRIRVEGHADDRPVGGRLAQQFPSNWELAAARASAVARYLQAKPDLNPERFEVVSFGPSQPRASNDTAEGRALNRRIRVAVLTGLGLTDEQ